MSVLEAVQFEGPNEKPLFDPFLCDCHNSATFMFTQPLSTRIIDQWYTVSWSYSHLLMGYLNPVYVHDRQTSLRIMLMHPFFDQTSFRGRQYSIHLPMQFIQSVESLFNDPFLAVRVVQYMAAGTNHQKTGWPRASSFKGHADVFQR
jgi:hypothetical protein